jgi:hypothetical protein
MINDHEIKGYIVVGRHSKMHMSGIWKQLSIGFATTMRECRVNSAQMLARQSKDIGFNNQNREII